MRRTTRRWLEGAPPQVYACYDMGERYADRYTVIVGPEVDWDNCKWVSVLHSSATLHCSGWSEHPTTQVAEFRRRYAHRKITWSSLPEHIRLAVCEDTEV